MISFCDRVHSHKYRMTSLTALPLPTDEPRAESLLFPEVHAAQAHVNASGNSPISSERSQPLADNSEDDECPSEPVRHSAMVPRSHDRTPSSSRLVLAQDQPRSAANSSDRLISLVHDHTRAVWRALRRLGVPADLLDDATQEVFIIASRKLYFIDDGAERSFLYGTALRVAANLRRSSQARQHDTLSDNDTSLWQTDPDQEQLVHSKHLRVLLDQILDKMPDDLREVFVLFELEKFTRAELSELLGVPAGTVASRLRRARELFEDACEKLREFPEGGPR